MREFETLRVWQDAHRLALDIYDTTASFPRQEQTVLVGQMRRAGNSVPGNIAEGAGLETDPQLVRHLVIASGSSSELEYFVRLSRDLGYITPERELALRSDIRAVRKQIWGFIRYLRSDQRTRNRHAERKQPNRRGQRTEPQSRGELTEPESLR